jgi:hypothetical protein
MTAMPPPQQTRQIQGQGPAANPLPPTGIQQQAASIQQSRQSQLGTGGPLTIANPAQGTSPAGLQPPSPGFGATSLTQLARKLSSSYGLSLGRDDLVDAQGNFLQTPDQVAAASGGRETKGSAAAKFNLIADAIQRQQQQQQMHKSESALQAGLGLVQSRGRGSLAAMQSGFYQGLSNLYQSQQYQAADFSYFIQAEQMDRAQELLNKQLKAQKRGGIGGAIGGIAGMIFGGPGGGAIGSSIGSQIGSSWF